MNRILSLFASHTHTCTHTHLVYTLLCRRRIEAGSLKDVLENEAIQLDWNFRMSLIHDIVKVSVVHTPILNNAYAYTHKAQSPRRNSIHKKSSLFFKCVFCLPRSLPVPLSPFLYAAYALTRREWPIYTTAMYPFTANCVHAIA